MVKREFSEYEDVSDEGSDSGSDSDGPPPRSRIKLESDGDSPFHAASHSFVVSAPTGIKPEPDLDRKDVPSIPTQVAAPLIDGTASTKVCMKCGEQGHLVEQCPKNSCKKCGKDATHLTAFCPVLDVIRKKTKGPCGKCGKLGHGRRKCKVLLCDGCGAQGHTRKTCPTNPPPCGFCRKPGHRGKTCPFADIFRAGRNGHYVDGATQTAEV